MMKLAKVFLSDNSCIGREIKFHPFCKNTTWIYLRLGSPSMDVSVPSSSRWRNFDIKRSRHIIERLKFFKNNLGKNLYTGGIRYNLGRDYEIQLQQ